MASVGSTGGVTGRLTRPAVRLPAILGGRRPPFALAALGLIVGIGAVLPAAYLLLSLIHI